jgi:hypothetical protein
MKDHNIFREIPRTTNTRIIHVSIDAIPYYHLPVITNIDRAGSGKTTIEEIYLGCRCEHGYRFGYSHRYDVVIVADGE